MTFLKCHPDGSTLSLVTASVNNSMSLLHAPPYLRLLPLAAAAMGPAGGKGPNA
jgi:hypothetical protein